MATNDSSFAPLGNGTGLMAEYYDNSNFTNLKLTRTDSRVNFNWGSGSPSAGISADTFSARWTGTVQPQYSEDYTFYVRSDDGARLWVNSQLVVDDWTAHSVRETSGTIRLEAGRKYDIKLEYYENKVLATAQLSWFSASQAKQIIPKSQLYTPSTDSTLPTASLFAPSVVTGGVTNYLFTVTYTDNAAINVASLDSHDIRVTGENGFDQAATLVGVDNSNNGKLRTATYLIAPPDGSWSALDNGTYAVVIRPNQVSDTSTNFLLAGTLGSFQVSIVEPINNGGIVFPADSGVIDVRNFGAIPDDGIDDTAAIQQALNTYPSGNHIFYFSDGVYDVSNTLSYAGTQKRNILQGQSRDGTIIRLKDNSGLNGPVIWTGNPPAQRFRNGIRDLTVDIGSGNPEAVGIQFIANNQGTLRDVTIVSRDRQGAIGLDLGTDENGPTLIKNVEVIGFDVGIRTWNPTASQTFEHIRLENQNRYGWQNYNQTVFVRDLQSTNAVTAIWNMPDGGSNFTLIDSTLTGVGAATNLPAVYNQKGMYVRNLTTSGYNLAILQDDKGRGNPSQPNGYVREWIARGAFESLFTSPVTSLDLAIAETPEIPWDNLSDWASPLAYGGLPNDGIDDTTAIQAAIDSGAKTVYLPNGNWDLNGQLELRSNVQRFLGTEASVSGIGSIQVGNGTAPTVAIERIETRGSIKIIDDTTRTLVLSSMILSGGYTNTSQGTGNVFIEDVSGGPWTFRNQNVWARQLNPEVPNSPRVLNDGGNLWILGYKTEDAGTLVETINGGKTEVIGAYLLQGDFGDIPAFINTDSSLSFVSAGFITFSGGSIPIGVKETRDGITRTTSGLPTYYSGYR